MGEKFKSILYKRITRRSFIKKGLIGLAGLSLSAYAINKLVSKHANVFENQAPEELWKWSKEIYNYKKLSNKVVQCLNCPRQCILKPGERSFCRNKVNIDGKFYTLAYGNPCSVHIDPIEKKPLNHFLPTTASFSIASAGCTFRCLNCQNWEISQSKPEDTQNYDMMPEAVVDAAIKNNCASIAYTYSEPSAFYEYMYDTSKVARQNSIRNVWVTNGYLNEKPLRNLCKVMDAANVDLKSFKEEIYNELNSGNLQPVLNTLKILKEEKVWFEVTNLVVPSWTDDLNMIRDMCKWLVKNVGKDYPLHFSRFYPMYKLTHLPQTPIKFLEEARKTALDEGLNYVYIGNVPGSEASNTYCPSCKKLIIKRLGYSVDTIGLQGSVCKFCGQKIAGVWR